MKAYAGIGSRETPVPILNIMEEFAEVAAKNYILRSGGAAGADEAFYRGAVRGCDTYDFKYKDRIEIFLPWDGFGGLNTNQHDFTYLKSIASHLIAEQYHPSYSKLSDAGKALMARNSMQVLGRLLTSPSQFVLCYTSDGKASGGTGQALRIAKDRNIPIYNLYHKDAFHWCKNFIKNKGEL